MAGARFTRSTPATLGRTTSYDSRRLIRGEAVEQAVAADAPLVVLAAAAVRAGRGMRRIPRFRRRVVAQTLAFAVADHGRALGAARPVAAGSVLAGRERASIHLRAGQYVVGVGRVANTGNHGAALGERDLHAELVAVAMQVIDVLGDDLVFEILPRSPSDAIAGIDGLCAARRLGAQIRAPGLVAGARVLRQRLALTIRSFQAAKIRAFARSGAGDEKGHIRGLGWRLLCVARRRRE